MHCNSCNSAMPDGSTFCPACGAEQPKPAIPAPQGAPVSQEIPPPSGAPVAQESPVPEAAPQPYGAPAAYAPPPPTGAPAQQTGVPLQTGAPVAYAAPVAAAPKRSKAPLFIVLGIVLVLVVGAVVAFATGLIPNPFGGRDSALTTLSRGTEHLLYDVGSAHAEGYVSAGGTSQTGDLYWELGDDLRSSTFWGSSDVGGTEMGFVLKDDTLYVYYDSGSSVIAQASSESFVAEMNETLSEELGVDIDFNGVVSNGRFDRAYVEELNATLNESEADAYSYGVPLEGNDLDTEGITKITEGFMYDECSKEQVYREFILNLQENSQNGQTNYSFELDLLAFLTAYSSYALDVASRDSGLSNAGDMLSSSIGELIDEFESYNVEPVEMSFTMEGNILVGLVLNVTMDGTTVGMGLVLDGINETDLSDNTQLQEIIDSAF